MDNLKELIAKYVDEKFPSIPKTEWDLVQEKMEEAMKLEIL